MSVHACACTVTLGENALEILGVKHHGRVLYFLCLNSQRALADRCEVSGLTLKNLRCGMPKLMLIWMVVQVGNSLPS